MAGFAHGDVFLPGQLVRTWRFALGGPEQWFTVALEGTAVLFLPSRSGNTVVVVRVCAVGRTWFAQRLRWRSPPSLG